MEGIEYGYIHIKDGKVVGVRRHDSVAVRGLIVETLPACADIPLLPALLPPPGNPCLFSSA